MSLDDISKQLAEATGKAALLAERVREGTGSDDIKAIRAELDTYKGQVATLVQQREEAEQAEELKSLRAEIEELKAVRTGRKFAFSVDGTEQRPMDEPFAVTIYKARRRYDPKAIERLNDLQIKAQRQYAMEGKAVGEGTNPGGGYLVPPTYMQDLVALRRASAPLRGFVNVVGGIRSDLVYVPTQTAVETVAWTAENAAKTSTDETFGQIATNIFTLAGIAKISNQLLEDSSPAVDQIVQTSLGRGLAIEEDRAMINGSGTGQPTGILNTSGITSTAVSAGTAAAIFDDILSAIGRVQATYFGQPDAILMAPRTWSKMLTAKDSAGRYLTTGVIVGSQMMTLPGTPNPTGSMPGAITTFMGIPVIIDANMPVNLSGTLSAIIVGAFKEAWLLERDGIRMDMSSEAGTAFEQNQTWFRGEERVGFTAARLPSAFQIVSGETA
jgi:HK97 family phage major capsid protein